MKHLVLAGVFKYLPAIGHVQILLALLVCCSGVIHSCEWRPPAGASSLCFQPMQELMDTLGAPAISKPSLAIVFVAPEGIKEVQVAFGAEVCHSKTGISRSTEPRRCRQNMSTGNTTAKLLPVCRPWCLLSIIEVHQLHHISCFKSMYCEFALLCTAALQLLQY